MCGRTTIFLRSMRASLNDDRKQLQAEGQEQKIENQEKKRKETQNGRNQENAPQRVYQG